MIELRWKRVGTDFNRKPLPLGSFMLANRTGFVVLQWRDPDNSDWKDLPLVDEPTMHDPAIEKILKPGRMHYVPDSMDLGQVRICPYSEDQVKVFRGDNRAGILIDKSVIGEVLSELVDSLPYRIR